MSIYYCGATVQGEPHIGHARSAVCFDILRRWLEFQGETVRLIRNVTDIDDKILDKAAEAGEPSWAWAYQYERVFDAAYELLGVLPATYAPRATGHVPEMIALMARLIASGHAYESNGSVYFAVRSWPAYGSLSGQDLANMQVSGEAQDTDKRDLQDFALWKSAPKDQRGWDTPWGYGRPGWHLECSAMATQYCGAQFDIHGGGLDLVFPHHENEIAQSNAAGDLFANYWLHNHWVTTAGEKMSKSLGNALLVSELAQLVRPIELRYYLGAAHYRSVIEFSESALQEAAAGFRRIESFILRAAELVGAGEFGPVSEDFASAMNDDLGVPAAVAALHGAVTEGNSALTAGDRDAVARLLGPVRAMASVVGVDPLDPIWSDAAGVTGAPVAALSVLVDRLLADREEARAQKDFTTADNIRTALGEAGILIQDGTEGARWSLAR